MLINDESCNAEKTVLRYQENGIVDLLGSDWYGILLLSPGGRICLDTYNDIHGIGNEIPLRFVEHCIRWDSLQQQKTYCYEFEGRHFFIYTIRLTEKGNQVFFLHCKVDGPFDERDIRWYELYSTTGQQRMLLENELVQEKNYLSGILESTEGCIAVVDADYTILSANDNAQELFGDNLTTGSRKLLPVIKAVDKVLLMKEKQILPRVLLNEMENELGCSIYKFVLTPLKSSKGKVGCVVIVATDITQKFIHRRRVAQRQNFQILGDATFEMSKDMRTPLMNIQGCASLLLDEPNLTEEMRELLNFIQTEAGHISRINDQLISFCNLTEETSCAQIRIHHVLQNCVSALYRERSRKKLIIKTHLEEEMPMVQMKNVDLHQLFFNLLLSSLSSIREKGSIDVSSHYDKQKMAVVVKIAEDGEDGGQDREEELLYVRSGSGNLQNWIDVPLLMAKKITLDYGGTLEMKRQEDGRQVRMVTLPCIVS